MKGTRVSELLPERGRGRQSGRRRTSRRPAGRRASRRAERCRPSNFVQSVIIAKVVGVPSERLEARVGDKVMRGMEARDKMLLIVLTSDAKKAYETGVMDPMQPPKK